MINRRVVDKFIKHTPKKPYTLYHECFNVKEIYECDDLNDFESLITGIEAGKVRVNWHHCNLVYDTPEVPKIVSNKNYLKKDMLCNYISDKPTTTTVVSEEKVNDKRQQRKGRKRTVRRRKKDKGTNQERDPNKT